MSGRVNLLSALLAVQLVIIGLVLLGGTRLGEADEGPFLEFDVQAVDEIRIAGADTDAETTSDEPGGDTPALVLTRGDDGWRLPDGLPADGDKVTDVLDQLAGLRAPWPVATSASAAQRFEVTEDTFQRHVTLLAGGDVAAELYLGTSPGYQQVHARRAGDDAVYGVAISNYQVPTDADEWLDKTLLQAQGEVSAVDREGAWRLSRDAEGWLVNEAAADQEAAQELVRRLSELRVTGAAQAPAADQQPAAVLSVTDGAGSYRLTLVAEPDSERYRVSSDRRDGWFGLSAFAADQLLEDKASLEPGPETAAQDTSEEDGSPTDQQQDPGTADRG